MTNIDRVNGVYRMNCIIMNRGFIPVLNCMGPILNPRMMDVNEVRLLIKLGMDVRIAGNDNRLDLMMVDNIMDEFVNGPKKQPVKLPNQAVKKEEVKKHTDVKSEPVVEDVKQQVVENVVEEHIKVQEDIKPKQQPKNNNKQNKNKK